MTREEIVTTIRALAEKLGHVPSFHEIEDLTPLRRRHVRKHFGSYTWALKECGLGKPYGGQKIPTDELFRDWALAVRKLKKIPSITEFRELGKYSAAAYQRRCKHWSGVPEVMYEHAKREGLDAEWRDVMELIERRHKQGWTATNKKWPRGVVRTPAVMKDRMVYPPLMTPAPLVHVPTNESAVIYLFGSMAAQLGFMVTRMQMEFPDCEALREVEPDRWQRVRIEFEYESRNFLRHMHAASECDLIVCWRHNWPECPLEVLELRRAISGQRPACRDDGASQDRMPMQEEYENKKLAARERQ